MNAKIELRVFRGFFFFLEENSSLTYTPLSMSPVSNKLEEFAFLFSLSLLKFHYPISIHAAASFSLITLLLTATFGSALNLYLPLCCLLPWIWKLSSFCPHSDLREGWEGWLYFPWQIPEFLSISLYHSTTKQSSM